MKWFSHSIHVLKIRVSEIWQIVYLYSRSRVSWNWRVPYCRHRYLLLDANLNVFSHPHRLFHKGRFLELSSSFWMRCWTTVLCSFLSCCVFLPWFGQSPTTVSSCSRGFYPRSFLALFVVDELAIGQVFLHPLWFPCIVISVAYTCFIHLSQMPLA